MALVILLKLQTEARLLPNTPDICDRISTASQLPSQPHYSANMQV